MGYAFRQHFLDSGSVTLGEEEGFGVFGYVDDEMGYSRGVGIVRVGVGGWGGVEGEV